MDQHNYDKQHTLNDLVSEYEAMSQKGTVVFYEETVFSQLIKYYEKEQAIEQALAVTNLALSQHHFSHSLYCKKAQLLALKKRPDAAINAIEQAEILSPGDDEIILLKANILRLLGDFDQALVLLDGLQNGCPSHNSQRLLQILFSKGMVYERLHDYDATFKALKQVLMLDPGHEEALNRIWICIEMSRNFEESIELCQQIIDHDPYCSMAWYNLGHAYTYFGSYEEAIDAYEYAFITNEKFEWAYRHCAELCMEVQYYTKALDCYKEVLTHIEPDGELLFKIGQCYHFLGKIEIAQGFYLRSIKLDEINDEVYFYLGECSAHTKNWRKAIYYYKRAIEIEGKREEYYAAQAKAYEQLKEYEKAFMYFDRAVELAPEQTNYWVLFATFLIRLEAYDTALEVLDDAENHSVGAELLYCRAICLFKQNHRKKAMKVLEEALVEDFDIYPSLFQYIPELETDDSIISMLEFYKYEK